MTTDRTQLIDALRGILAPYPDLGKIELERLRLTDRAVMEAPDGKTPLSDAILDACFPRADTTHDYVHYSSFETLRSVVDTGEWRLYWVFKRIHEDEYRPFCESHNLSEYLDKNIFTGKPEYESMSKRLFYTSLTGHDSIYEDQMWENFGDQGRGVRFTFRIRPIQNRSHFRPILYQNRDLRTLIARLQNATRNFNRELILCGISRIGAFYLPMHFYIEQEFRLLIKRFHESPRDYWNVQRDGLHKYVPIPINKINRLCLIKLIKVDAGPNRSQSEVDGELRRNPRLDPSAPRGCLGLFFPKRVR